MCKYFLTLFLFLFSSVNLFAQDHTRNFELTLPDSVIHNSLYNSIELLDSRFDTTDFGFVQWGSFDKIAKLVLKSPLSGQIESILKSATDSTAKNGKLLLQ